MVDPSGVISDLEQASRPSDPIREGRPAREVLTDKLEVLLEQSMRSLYQKASTVTKEEDRAGRGLMPNMSGDSGEGHYKVNMRGEMPQHGFDSVQVDYYHYTVDGKVFGMQFHLFSETDSSFVEVSENGYTSGRPKEIVRDGYRGLAYLLAQQLSGSEPDERILVHIKELHRILDGKIADLRAEEEAIAKKAESVDKYF